MSAPREQARAAKVTALVAAARAEGKTSADLRKFGDVAWQTLAAKADVNPPSVETIGATIATLAVSEPETDPFAGMGPGL